MQLQELQPRIVLMEHIATKHLSISCSEATIFGIQMIVYKSSIRFQLGIPLSVCYSVGIAKPIMEFRWNHRMDNKCSCCTQVKSNFYIFQYLLSSLVNVCISDWFTELIFAHFLIGSLIYCKLNLDLLSPIRPFIYLFKAINLIFCFQQPMRFRIL